VVIAPFDLIVKRIMVTGFFMNHPDIEPKIPQRCVKPHRSWSARSGAPIAATYPLPPARRDVHASVAERCFSIFAAQAEPASA